MAEERVLTYEATGTGVEARRRHESLAASSAALPDGAYTTFRTYGRPPRAAPRQAPRPPGRDDRARGRSRGSSTASPRAPRSPRRSTRPPGRETRLRLTFAPPRLFVAVEPFEPLPRAAYETGVACVTLALRRANPHAKDTRFIATARAAYRRLPAGIEEGLLVEQGAILEGLSSNFFAVVDGALRTEEERVLLGVTRSLVLEVAEGLLSRRAPGRARRASCRGSGGLRHQRLARGAAGRPIDGQPVGDGQVGPITRRVVDGFAALVAARRLEAL